MKQSRACPKCQSTKLWRIDEFAAEESGGPPAPLRAVVRRSDPNKPGFFGKPGTYSAGYVDAFICGKCGYTELWTRDLDELVHNPAAGVHLLDE
ncbi:MAG: hypothetical protein JRI23_18310 [Deltaproteobacteria bacterium]|jgi:predicted nucleic-acid-binding Zn-ribbon protein|nr:hypothetical protein [Deltaproteobacteria bacterium]MBW2533812.1 hypothetical protein [Deltaproteobacteria bacterium]